MAERDRSAYLKAWREANAESIKAYQKTYREANREKQKALAAAHYRANVDAYKLKAADWATSNPDRRRAIVAKWDHEHPEECAQARRTYWHRNREKLMPAERAYQQENADRMRELRKSWRERFPQANGHHVGLRRSRKLQATPEWADFDAVKAIYRQAKQISRETGIEHHVDHFYPLKGATVCGLHNEFNLRVIPASVNHAKKNRVIEE